ncbi:methionyl-tRNA formyltransferase [Chloroflexota bacterium]
MRIVFMGTPEFAVPALEHLIYNGYEIMAVYTQPDQSAGRGRSLTISPVKNSALGWHLPVVQPINFKDSATVDRLADFRPEVIVVAAFGQLLPQSVLGIPPYGCINIHPSLLPRFRGAAPVAGAILAGDDFTGVSIMLLDEGMDTGPVLARAPIPVSPFDTTGSLTSKLSQVGARLLQDVLAGWLRRGIVPQPQNDSVASYTSPVSKAAGLIDWGLPAVDIWRRVRAFFPWPGCYTVWQGKRLNITEAVALSGGTAGGIGRVIALELAGEPEAAFGIITGAGTLGVRKVQMGGKRVMLAGEFLRGQRQFIGVVLPVSD